MKDLLETILAYVIFIGLCAIGVGLFIMILKFVSWLLTWEYIRTGIIVIGCIGILAMLYEEFRKGE